MIGKEVCRLQFKKSSLLTKLLILAVAVYALITLVNLQDSISAAKKESNAVAHQLMVKEQEKAQLQQDLEDFGSDKSVKKLARQYLGMVEEGEIRFFDADMK